MYEASLKQLTEHVYYYVDHRNKRRPLVACIVGDDQVLFIDAGISIEHMQDMLNQFENMHYHQDLPRLGVITNSHISHVLGLQACHFPYIAHKISKENLQDMFTWDWSDKSLDRLVRQNKLSAREVKNLKKEWSNREDLEIQIPCIIYRHQLELDLGHISCMLEHIESDFSEDSTIVYLKEDQVLFIGDCMDFGVQHITPCYSKQLFTVIDLLLSYDAKYYVFASENKIMDRNEFIEHCEYLRLLGATVSQNYDDIDAIEEELGKIKKEDMKYIHAFIEGLKEGRQEL